MAALTWRDVTAPDYRGVQSSINSAADLLAKSTNGMSGALTQFGDQQALQKLAQYSDAQKLQADIQSGRFNTANASGEALATIMGRPANLLSNAASQQTFDFNTQKNPLELSRLGVANDISQEALAQSKLTNPLVVNALQRADDVGAYGQANRLAAIDQDTALNKVQYPAAQRAAQYTSDLANLNQPQQLLNTARTNAETNRAYPIQEGTRQAQEQVATLQNQGQLPSAVEGNAYFQQLVDSGAHPVVLNAVKGMLEQSYGKGTVGAVSTSVGGSVPSPVANVLNTAVAGSTGAGTRSGNSYDVVLGNGAFGLPPKPVSQSTLGELGDFGRNTLIPATRNNEQLGLKDTGKGSSAVGKYQFTQETVSRLAPAVFGKDWEKTVFTPENQDKLGEALFNETKGGNLKAIWQGLPNTTAGAYKDVPWSQMKEVISSVESSVNAPTTTPQAQAGTSATGATASTVLAQAATPASASATKPVDGESTDIFALRRKFQTLSQQSAALGVQDSTNFNADVLAGVSKGMDQATAITELRKDPAFARIAQSTIVEALNKAQEKSGLSDYGPLIPAIKRSLGSGSEFNFTSGEAVGFPYRSGTFDYDKLEKFSIQAGDLKEVIKSADGVAKRRDDIEQVSFLMPQLEALNTERVSLYQQKQLGRPGADAALAKVDERIAGLTTKINPHITKLDAELTGRVKNSPSTEAEIIKQSIADAKALKAAAGKSTAAASTDPAALIDAADKTKAPLRSTDGGKTWSLEVDATIRNPAVSYYQQIENPVFTQLKGKTFKSRAEAEKAYREAQKA